MIKVVVNLMVLCQINFGRIAELSRQFVQHREKIIQFFEDIVGENSNKLVLAVAEYIRYEWFLVCSTIYSKLDQLMIFPLMESFGIDRKTRHQGDDSKCDWFQVKDYFQCHLPDWRKSNSRFYLKKLMALICSIPGFLLNVLKV